MTALCGGGASQARPGIVDTAFNTAASITSYLRTFLPLPLAIAIGAVAAVETFDVALYCGTDPPADPGLTAQDIADFLNPAALDTYLPAQAKIRLWWRHVYWWQVCECANVATPPLPPPSNPGAQSSNPGLPSGGVSSCYTSKAGYTATGVTSGTTQTDVTTVWLPSTDDTHPVTVTTPLGNASALAMAIPSDVTAISFTTQNQGAATGPGNNAMQTTLAWFTAAGASAGGTQFMTSQAVIEATPATGTPVPSGAHYWAMVFTNTVDVALSGKQASWSVELNFICGGTQVQAPCCPPDPGLELKINQLFQLVLGLGQSSAPVVPVGWHDGTRHSALRGAGSFLIDTHAIGMRFEITTPPSGTFVDPGNPDFYWDMGFWSPYAVGSPLRGGRLVFLSQSVQLPEFSDQIGYTLKHGTVMDAIELLPTTP